MRFAKPVALLIALVLSNSLVGCGGKPAAPPTEEEKKQLNEQMQQDMKKMQGLPKSPSTKKNK